MGISETLAFTGVNGLIKESRKGLLSLERLQETRPPPSVVSDAFREAWRIEVATGKPSLRKALQATYWQPLAQAASYKLAWSALIVTCASWFIRYLLAWVRTPNPPFAGWLVACCFFVACVALSVALQQTNAVSSRLGAKVAAALAAEIYEKSLREDRISNPAPVDVVSLVATDCSKLQEAAASINFLWSAVVEALAIVSVLLILVGRSALPGLGLVLLVIPAQYGLGLAVAKLRKNITIAADARVARMDEILRAIKLVKCYAWERPFSAMVASYRSQEVSLLAWSGVLKSVNLALVFSLPPLIAISIFGVHSIESDLDSGLAFTTLSLFNTLRLPLVVLPKCLRSFAEALAALKRVEAYLLAPERLERPKHAVSEIVLKEASYTWGRAEPLLRDITLTVTPGQLVMVFGPVGSGKTNLVSAILGRMNLTSGTEAVGGRFAYVPQKPWCQFGTVRENILFGAPYDEARYRQVVRACALEHDLAILPDGDLTVLGERGANISGGQQQRIALARAAYSDSDTFVLDSPLSAVDMYTSQHIFKHCIKGVMRGKTVLLVTHQVELLPEASTCVVMEKGTFSYCGPYTTEVGRKLGVETSALALARSDAAVEGVVTAVSASGGASSPTGHRSRSSSQQSEGASAEHIPRTPSMRGLPGSGVSALVSPLARERAMSIRASILSGTAPAVAGAMGIDGASAPGVSLEVIRKSTSQAITRSLSTGVPGSLSRYRAPSMLYGKLPDGGDVIVTVKTGPPTPPVDPLRVARPAASLPPVNGYLALVAEAGILLVIVSLIVFVATQTIRIMSDTWISLWVSKHYPGRDETYYIEVYAGYVASFILALLTRGLLFFHIFRSAATRLHNKQFAQIVNAPLSFFITTPVGRVLSVFSRDQDMIDEALLDNIHMTIIYFCILATTMAVVIRVVSFFAAIVGVLLLAFAFFFNRYMAASAAIKQLLGGSNSLLLAHVSETLQGLAVIQAYEAQGRFVADNRSRISNVHLAGGALDDLQGWLSFRMDFVASLLVLGTTLLCVGLRASISAANAGLAVSNSFQILLFMTLMVRGAAEIHANIPSVERVVQLTKVEPEPDVPLSHESCPRESWPSAGEVTFHGVVMSYAKDTPAVLKGVDFNVLRGEKIGIVGRTGAGKSSLVMALFRLAEMSKGEVRIDGVNTKVLNLQELRRRIAIVPQEPVLFNGTLRFNLDPFHVHSDEELWEALARCHLAEYVRAQKGGLDYEIQASGAGFSLSLGQAQLISLARAVLNKSKLLVLDEATSALDLETDRLVQQTIREVFSDRTVLTIAHRLDTIIDSDRILVMSEGRVAEFDTPLALLQRADGSIFRGLCEQTGASFESLYAAAEQHQRTTDALTSEAARELEDGGAPFDPLPMPALGGSGGEDGPEDVTGPFAPGATAARHATISVLDTVEEGIDESGTLGPVTGRSLAARVQAALASEPMVPSETASTADGSVAGSGSNPGDVTPATGPSA